MQRLGLFGGTFNPVHIGHLRVAEEVREELSLERVIFIPSYIPPHKQSVEIVAPEHRLAMVRLAVAEHEAFGASDLEIQRADKSYSIFTLRHFSRELAKSGELFFILGADAFAEITTWHRWMEVLPMAHFVIMTRPHHVLTRPLDALPAAYAERYTEQTPGRYQMQEGARLIFLPVTGLDISSSDIRRRIGEKRSIRYLMPDTVARYIQEHGLYR